MKTLTLMRHGKSSWDYNVSDKDRPLLERGINDAYLVAAEQKKAQSNFDAVFSSPANRALHTCIIFLRVVNISLRRLEVVEDLYDFSGENVLQFIQGLDNEMDNVILFGHNHAFTSLANLLGDKSIENLPTAGLVTIEFKEKEWRSVKNGTTKNIIVPKTLRE